MDRGPETKKARLSTTDSTWAPSPTSSSFIHHHAVSLPSPNPASHHPPHQQHQLLYHQAQHHQHHQHGNNHNRNHHNQHQPAPSVPGPYQAGHPPSSSAAPVAASNSSPFPRPPYPPSYPHASHTAEYLPPPATSPAPPTPVPAQSYTHTVTLPLPTTNDGINGRHSHSRSHSHSHLPPHSHNLDDAHHHDPEPYSSGQDQRQQDYRPPHFQHQRQLPPDTVRQEPRQPPSLDYRPDYRLPLRSPVQSASGPPPPSAYTAPYGRGDKQQQQQQQQQQVNDDLLLRNRPGSAASASGTVHSQQRPSPTPSQQQMDDSRRQMSFENIAHPNPNLGGHHYPLQPPLQPPQHPQPPQPPQLPQHSSPHLHGHMQHAQVALPLQVQPPAPPPPPPAGSNAMFRPPSYTPATPTTMSHPPPPSHPAPHQQQEQQQPQQTLHAPPPQHQPLPQNFETQPMYSQAASLPPQSAEVMYPMSYAAASKKKAQRASQACDSCRSLKAKCDETKPCKNCREKNIECKYRDPIPKQQDKVSADILDSINMMQSRMDGAFMNEMRSMRQELLQRISTLEGSLKTVAASVEAFDGKVGATGSTDATEGRDMEVIGEDGALAVAAGAASRIPRDPSKPPLSANEAQRIVRQMQDDYAVDVAPGPTVPPGEPAIPAHHTTLAGLLLTWPTINERVSHLLKAEGIHYVYEYPIRQEEQRGLLRLHGRGEGFDTKPAFRTSDYDRLEPLRSLPMELGISSQSSSKGSIDNEGSGESAPFSGEMWGQIGDFQLPSYADYTNGTPLRQSGDLDLSSETVWKYVKSYEDHIQNMHPLIIPKELYAMVTRFLRTIPKANSSGPGVRAWGSAPAATFTGSPDEMSEPIQVEGSLKRKRSPGDDGLGDTGVGGSGAASSSSGNPHGTPTLPLRPGLLFRTIESALVLSILALGKICLHRNTRIPDVVPEYDASSPVLNNVQPSPSGFNANMNNNGTSSVASAQVSPSVSSIGGSRGTGSPPCRRVSQSGAPPKANVARGAYAATATGAMPSATTSGQRTGAMSANIAGSIPASSPGGSIGGSSGSVKGSRPSVTARRNLDVIPGLDYFAAASNIFGEHSGGRELKHVWVYIIGCLYYGQLARPVQSLEMIAMAGRHLQAIIRPNLHRYSLIRIEETFGNSKPEGYHRRDTQYIFAFWTCVQLESDILAELQLPPSGILAYEQKVPYPNANISVNQGFDFAVLESYAGQLYIRNLLNDIHRNLYDGGRDQDKVDVPTIEVFADILKKQSWVPKLYRFRDEDPPPADILAARLRAKYWGAQVIVHRFLIRRILEFNYHRRVREEKKQAALDAIALAEARGEQLPADFVPPSAYEPDAALLAQEEETFSKRSLNLARRGIQALVESTRAFHGLPDKRYIITNVFGTAHAQWGNLLVLDSIQRDPCLGRYISEEFVNDLFCKTIAFFEIVSQPSSSLGYDLRILKGLYARRLSHPVSMPQEPPQTISPQGPPSSSPQKPSSSASLPPTEQNGYVYSQIPPSYPVLSNNTGATTWNMQPGEWSSSAQNVQQNQSVHPPSYPPTTTASSPKQTYREHGANKQQHQQPVQMPPAHSPMQVSPVAPHHQQPHFEAAAPASGTTHVFGYQQQAAYISPSGVGSGMQSPVQSRPPLQFPTSAVKTPSTPSDSEFPHHLPSFMRRTYD